MIPAKALLALCLFGAFILVTITGSFWLYARQTEHLAYDQIATTCRLLVVQIIDRQLATGCRSTPGAVDETQKRTARALEEFREKWERIGSGLAPAARGQE